MPPQRFDGSAAGSPRHASFPSCCRSGHRSALSLARRFTHHVGSLLMKREAGTLSGQKRKWHEASLASAGWT